jgi:hypothetical protein
VRAHQAYIVSATTTVPTILHRSEASLFMMKYTALPTADASPHALVLSWRLIDTKTSRSVATGTIPLGTLQSGATGTFFAPFVAPAVLGSYRLAYDVRERNVAASETFTANVTIVGARTFPDDEGGRTPPVITPRATPTPTPRMRFPSPTSGVIPNPQLPVLPVPRGRTSTPSP